MNKQTPMQTKKIEALTATAAKYAGLVSRALGHAAKQCGGSEYSDEMAMLYDQQANESADYILQQIERAKKLNPTEEQVAHLWNIYHLAQIALSGIEEIDNPRDFDYAYGK